MLMKWVDVRSSAAWQVDRVKPDRIRDMILKGHPARTLCS